MYAGMRAYIEACKDLAVQFHSIHYASIILWHHLHACVCVCMHARVHARMCARVPAGGIVQWHRTN